jgi:hypothetical protein
MGIGGLFPGVKVRQERDADHSPPCSAEVVNERSYFSSPSKRLHGVQRDCFLRGNVTPVKGCPALTTQKYYMLVICIHQQAARWSSAWEGNSTQTPPVSWYLVTERHPGKKELPMRIFSNLFPFRIASQRMAQRVPASSQRSSVEWDGRRALSARPSFDRDSSWFVLWIKTQTSHAWKITVKFEAIARALLWCPCGRRSESVGMTRQATRLFYSNVPYMLLPEAAGVLYWACPEKGQTEPVAQKQKESVHKNNPKLTCWMQLWK